MVDAAVGMVLGVMCSAQPRNVRRVPTTTKAQRREKTPEKNPDAGTFLHS